MGTRRNTPRDASWGRIGGIERTGVIVLSAVAGYVDTISFLALFGLFAAHITGDLVAAGVLVSADFRPGAWVRLAMVPVFVLAVGGASLLSRALRRRGESVLSSMLALQTIALAGFCAIGVALESLAKANDPWAVGLIGGSGVVAMAIQNTLMRDVLRGWSPTTLMTGNLTQFTIELVATAIPPAESSREGRARARRGATRRLAKSAIPLASFLFGGLSGAWATMSLGFLGIALPTLAVGALAGWILQLERQASAGAVRTRRPAPARRWEQLVRSPLP